MFPTQLLPYEALDPPIEGLETVFCRGPVIKIDSCSQKMVIFHDPLRNKTNWFINPPSLFMDFPGLKKGEKNRKQIFQRPWPRDHDRKSFKD